MGKRFIDTGLFDDSWFMDLSKDCKIMWLYLITKCDHAGIIDLNEKLCKIQTGITDVSQTIKLLGNRCHSVKEQYYFIPKFIFYQYPNFPNSLAKAQLSAIDRLNQFNLLSDDNSINYDLINNSCQTVTQLLPNSVSISKGLSNGKGKVSPEEFYKSELELSGNDPMYKKYIDFLFGTNDIGYKFEGILSIEKQIKYIEFQKLLEKSQIKGQSIRDLSFSFENGRYYKGKTSLYFSLNDWLNKR